MSGEANGSEPMSMLIGVTVAVLVIAAIIVFSGYLFKWEWTGLSGQIFFWDWLDLLIIPAALGAIGLWLNRQQQDRQKRLELFHKQEEGLREYLNQMSSLLVDKEPKPGDSVSALIRAWTLSLLERLHAPLYDPTTIGTIVQFLYESRLITIKEGPVVRLAGANLQSAVLTRRGLPSPALGRTKTDPKAVDMSDRIFEVSLQEFLCAQPIPAPELDLSGVCLSRTRLNEALLIGIDLSDADLSEAALLNTSLTGSRLINTDLSDAILVGARLDWADLSGATLFDAILSGFNLGVRSADLSRTKLNGAKLSGADLREVDLTGACLPNARLSPLDKDYQKHRTGVTTNLSGTNLSSAYLKEADLRQVNLTGADLTDADLSGADMTDAKVPEEQLVKCKSLEGATMPDGQTLKSDDNPDGLTFEEWRQSRGEENSGPS